METKMHTRIGDTELDLQFAKSTYVDDGNLAVVAMYTLEGEDGYFPLTVNLRGPLMPNCAYIDVNNLRGVDVVPRLTEQKILKPLGRSRRSGFVDYPLVAFDAKWLKELPTME